MFRITVQISLLRNESYQTKSNEFCLLQKYVVINMIIALFVSITVGFTLFGMFIILHKGKKLH